MPEIIINIDHSPTIEHELDNMRVYLYTRQAFLKSFRELCKLSLMEPDYEIQFIQDAMYNHAKSYQDGSK